MVREHPPTDMARAFSTESFQSSVWSPTNNPSKVSQLFHRSHDQPISGDKFCDAMAEEEAIGKG